MRAALVAILALLLAGCSVPKKGGFDDVARLVRDRGGPKLSWNQGSKEDRDVEAHVRKLLGEPLTAAAAVEIAVLGNPKLQATYERLGVAQADLVQAGLLRNPSIGAHFGLPGLGGPSWTGLAWELSLAQQFLDLFMLPLKKRLARAEFERVKLEVADDVLELVKDVRVAFYTVQAAQQIVDMQTVVTDASEASAELAERQLEAGTMNELDMTSEQTVFAQQRVDLLRSDQKLLGDRERLNRLLGVWGRQTAWKVSPRLPDLPNEELALEHLESFAVAHRLDLAAARQELEILRAELRATQATRWIGSLELGGDAHQEPEGTRVIGPSFNIALPIFDQGQARVARLVARYRQARRTYETQAIEIRSEVRELRNRLVTARATAEAYRTTLLPLRERLVALSQQQYNAMLLSVYQLLQTKQQELNTYREYLEVVRDYWTARAELERVAGAQLPMKEGGHR